MTPLTDFAQYVTDVQASSLYTTWVRQNQAEAARWVAYRQSVLAGTPGTAPPMLTSFGRSLVDAARMAANALPPPTPTPGPTPTPAPSSWWDASAAQLDPQASALIETWLGYGVVNPNLAFGEWAVATARAAASDPSYSVPLTDQGGSIFARVPVGTQPDPSGDGHLTVRDPAAGTDTDFWQAVYDPSTRRIKSASAGASFPLGQVNEGTSGWGGNAANLALRPFLVTPEEIKVGLITHPLAFGCPSVGTGSPRYPALHNAPTGPAGHLVEGTWLRLDPDFDVSKLTGWQKTVAAALQRYGMFLRDSSGSFVVYGENTINRGGLALWAAAGLAGSSAGFGAGFPWGHMQVLTPPETT